MRRGQRVGRAVAGWVAAALIMGGGSADGAAAQEREYWREPVRGRLGITFVAADPRGEMGQIVDQGFGGQLDGSWALDESGHVNVRADMGFLIYGHERYSACFSAPIGCRIELDVSTTNSIFFGGVGPELVLATGTLQPYVNASFGFSYFATNTSLSGIDEAESWANTTNFSDAAFSWRAGGGVRIRVSNGKVPVSLDFAVDRHDSGVVDYLTEGDIQDNPDGSITVFPTRSEAELLQFRVGVSLGFRPGAGDDGHDRRRGRRGRR